MISSANLTKRFGQHTAVDAVTFDLPKGVVAALLGPNGAGKSTLLRLLSGLLRADTGAVSVAGHNPAAHSPAFRKAIGVLPENLALLPELSIEEQLSASGPIYGLDKRTTRQRSQELLEMFGLGGARQTYARDGSHGMRKKTAIALALLHNPQVLLRDEPFEGLDPASADRLAALFTAIGSRGATVLFSSHMLPIVDRISNRTLVMRDGRIVRDEAAAGSPGGAERLYFDATGAPPAIDLPWLGSPRS